VAPALFVCLVFGVYFFDPEASDPDEATASVTELAGTTFGTTFSVKVVEPSRAPEAEQALVAAVNQELTLVDRQMSTWKADSLLSQLNRAPVGEAFAITPPLKEVLLLSQEIHARSGGAFDVTVGPLVNRWGFGPDGRPQAAPSDVELAALQASTGQRHLTLDPTAPSATRSAEGLTVDLSAVAKGYAVDRVSRALNALGAHDHMVEIGGEVVARGRNASGQPWRIAIEQPDSLARSPMDVVSLDDEAMATSGDYRNYLEIEGTRYSHSVDPRTGRPVTHALASVTVVATDCASADAWATALTVLGPDEGIAVANREGIAAFFLVRNDDGFERRASAAYAARSE
jgi:thiamine biosynthesis lipoprotein